MAVTHTHIYIYTPTTTPTPSYYNHLARVQPLLGPRPEGGQVPRAELVVGVLRVRRGLVQLEEAPALVGGGDGGGGDVDWGLVRAASCVCVGVGGGEVTMYRHTHQTLPLRRMDRPTAHPPTHSTPHPAQHTQHKDVLSTHVRRREGCRCATTHPKARSPTQHQHTLYVRRPGGCWCALSPPRSSRAPWRSWRRWGRCRRRRSGPEPREGGRA